MVEEVTMVLLAASPISALLAFHFSYSAQSYFGRFPAVPYSLRFGVMN